MSRLLAVAARELRERWLLFPAGLAYGCIPLAVPWSVFALGVSPRDVTAVGLVFAVILGASAAVVIGSSMLARDAASGRLGFLFSRPVPWAAIWGGKWVAALVLVTVAGFLTAAPTMVTHRPPSGGSWLQALSDGPGALFVFTAIVFLVGLANFTSTGFRARSPWLAGDLLLLLAGIWTARHWVAPLWLYGVLGRDDWTSALALAPLALALAVGSVAQVAVGRTDVRRGHHAMSLAFWAVVAIALAAAAGYWRWARSAGPADVEVHAVTRDPAGRWVYVEGSGPHSGWYPHGLLIEATSGRYARRPEPGDARERFGTGMSFSADGRYGALLKFGRDGRGAAVSLFDLAGESPRLTEVTLESSPSPTFTTAFALSPTATSVFVVYELGASLYELPGGRRLATTTIPAGWRPSGPSALRFPAEGRARAWLVPRDEGPSSRRAEMRVLSLTPDGASTSVPFPIAAPLPAGNWGTVVPDADGRRIVTSDAGLHLRDGATGELRATLVEGEGRLPVLFLADGRILAGDGPNAAQAGTAQALLRVFDPSGAPSGTIPLDLSPWGLAVGPEVAGGRVVVSSFRNPGLPEDSLLVDLGAGRVVERISGLRPAIGFWDVSSAVPAGAAVTSAHVFRDAEGRVIRIDFATGERRIVAGPGAPRGERLALR
ncbi:MAG TPA: hypothetical protein VMT70_07645 [Vicinamibacteria bacterium]|nr:hypothetical protein [Vicinamibacteria bacterium]